MADTEPWRVVEAGGVRAVAARCDEPGKDPGFVVAQLNTLSMRHARLVCAAPEMARALRHCLPALEAAGAKTAAREARRALRVVDGRDRPREWKLGEEVLLKHQAAESRRIHDAIAAYAAAEELRFQARLSRERRARRVVGWRERLALHLGARPSAPGTWAPAGAGGAGGA
ncbi:MAG: hypothetical protein ACRD13_09385, partial [Terriglobales bacterium]